MYKKKHKEEINEKRKEKYTCECGSKIRKEDKIQHERSKKHINFIEGIVIQKPIKFIVSYYDEKNNNKKCFINLLKEDYDEFKKEQSRLFNNYRSLRNCNLIKV